MERLQFLIAARALELAQTIQMLHIVEEAIPYCLSFQDGSAMLLLAHVGQATGESGLHLSPLILLEDALLLLAA